MRFEFELVGGAPAATPELHRQVAAIPVRWVDGHAEILLVTTRGKGRWMVPKGWPVTDAPNARCAAREAFEEAGVIGRVNHNSLGEFEYEKKEGKARVRFRATAFLMEVDYASPDWPEREDRKRTWFPLHVAQALVNNAELAALMAEAVRRQQAGSATSRLQMLQ